MIRAADRARYLLKSGDRQIAPFNLIENEHGFATHLIEGDTLVVIQMYGDGKYWFGFFEGMAKEKGLKRIMFQTRRNYKAFERKYGYRKIGYVMEKEV